MQIFSQSSPTRALGRATRTLSRCLVCGFRELRTDLVVDRGLLLLAECPHCEHRFTRRLPDSEAGFGPAESAPRQPARAAAATGGVEVAA